MKEVVWYLVLIKSMVNFEFGRKLTKGLSDNKSPTLFKLLYVPFKDTQNTDDFSFDIKDW
jgi:hypothetical protein